MAKLIVVSWRDIPSLVMVKSGRDTAKVSLSERFQKAIDRAAMRAGRGGSAAYIADWQRTAPRPCSPDMENEARAEAARLEAAFDDAQLERLVRAGGLAAPRSTEPGGGD